jgi:hypothetical protein
MPLFHFLATDRLIKAMKDETASLGLYLCHPDYGTSKTVTLLYKQSVFKQCKLQSRLKTWQVCCVRGQLKCDGTHAETRFRLSAKRMSPFKSAGGHQFGPLLAAEVCASAVVMLDTPCSEVV